VVGHDPASGEVHHYTYPSGQSTYLPRMITASSDVPPQHGSQPTSVPSAATLGAGDGSGAMMASDNLLASSHHAVPDPRHHGTTLHISTEYCNSCKTPSRHCRVVNETYDAVTRPRFPSDEIETSVPPVRHETFETTSQDVRSRRSSPDYGLYNFNCIMWRAPPPIIYRHNLVCVSMLSHVMMFVVIGHSASDSNYRPTRSVGLNMGHVVLAIIPV